MSDERRPYLLERGASVVVTSPRGRELACVVLAPLAEGTNSRTWLARAADGAHVVLKASRWLDPGRVESDLLIEERILAPLDSPALIRFLGGGTGPHGKRVLCFERAFENPLLTLARPEVRRVFTDPGTRYVPLPPPVTLSLAKDLLRGVEYLHGQGFVHHDVKLTNLMVRVPEKDEVVPGHKVLSHALQGRARGVLIDIGASRSMSYLEELNAGRADQDVSVVAPQLTPLYAPPESLLENETKSGRRRLLLPSLDVYAAGIVIYCCAAGRLPYEDQGLDAETWGGLLGAKADEKQGRIVPLSWDAIRGSAGYGLVATDLYALLTAMTHRDPAKRPKPGEARLKIARLFDGLPAAAKARFV